VRGVTVATYTSLGTGTTEQTLHAGKELTIPSNARQIVAIQPIVAPVTPTAAEPVMAQVSLDSDDLPLKPCTFATAPIQPLLGTTGGLVMPNQPVYAINMPCAGGEKITVKGKATVANTVAPYMGVAVYYDTDPPTLPILHGKTGTLTGTGTAVAEVPDANAMSINGGTVLELAYGVVGLTTIAASKPYIGRGKISSSDLSPPFPSDFPIAPVGPVLSTAGIATSPDIMFADIGLALKQNATLTLSHFLDLALTTEGKFQLGVIYT
jgi:hypothetical protein